MSINKNTNGTLTRIDGGKSGWTLLKRVTNFQSATQTLLAETYASSSLRNKDIKTIIRYANTDADDWGNLEERFMSKEQVNRALDEISTDTEFCYIWLNAVFANVLRAESSDWEDTPPGQAGFYIHDVTTGSGVGTRYELGFRCAGGIYNGNFLWAEIYTR